MPQRTNTDGTLGSYLDGSTITLAYILRMDIVGDPVFVWTGYGDLTFGASETGDSALDGQTFQGITHLIADISPVEDGQGGSNGVEVSLPGIDYNDEAMRQIVRDKRRWQFLPGRLWLVFLDNTTGAVVGKPVRLRSGKMDQIIVGEDDEGTGVVACTIESQQAYASEALNTRYSEQSDLDATDTSQKWVWQLANMNPQIGKPFSLRSAGSGGGGALPPGVRPALGSVFRSLRALHGALGGG